MRQGPPVVGLGLTAGSLIDEPLCDGRFPEAKREMERRVAQFIGGIEIGPGRLLRLDFRKITAKYGQVNFIQTIVAFQFCRVVAMRQRLLRRRFHLHAIHRIPRRKVGLFKIVLRNDFLCWRGCFCRSFF